MQLTCITLLQLTCINSICIYRNVRTISFDASSACYRNRFAIRESERFGSAYLTIPIHSHRVNNYQQLQFITKFPDYSCGSIVSPVDCNPSEPRTPGRGSHFRQLNTGLLLRCRNAWYRRVLLPGTPPFPFCRSL